MRYPNVAEVRAVYNALDKPMGSWDISLITMIPQDRVIVALKALSYQRRIGSRKAGKRRLYFRRKGVVR